MLKIGIDFGTAYTTVSLVEPRTKLVIPFEFEGLTKIPTMIYYPSTEEDTPAYGQEAFRIYEHCTKMEDQSRIKSQLADLYSDLKMEMTKGADILLSNGLRMSYAEMIGEFFKYIKAEIERCYEGEQVTDVCITYPVAFRNMPDKKEILIEAGLYAGFSNVKLLLEPVAAAMGYGIKQLDDDNYITHNRSMIVYDFGAGTFDLVYFKLNNEKEFSVPIEPRGLKIGGRDIDKRIYDLWEKHILSQKQGSVSLTKDGKIDIPFLKKSCKEDKEELSILFKSEKKQKHYLDQLAAGNLFHMEVSKQQWIDIVAPIVDKTMDETRKMIAEIKEKQLLLDRVILIGGSSRITLISERLKEIPELTNEHGQFIVTPVPDTDTAVSKGATVFINTVEGLRKRRCYCTECGHEIDTSMAKCPKCDTINIDYDARFSNMF